MSAQTSAQVRTESDEKVSGFVPPLVTPMSDGEVDHDSLKRVLDDIAEVVSGVLIGGSVGEIPSLTVEERIGLMQTVKQHLDQDKFFAFSVADNSIRNTLELAAAAEQIGVDLLVVFPPNYFASDIRMLKEYFAAVSAATHTNLCLYDNPEASHTELSVEDIRAIMAVSPTLNHVKVTDTSIEKVRMLRESTDLTVLSGEDAVLWHQLNRGATGAMVALPMIYPELVLRFWKAFTTGDKEKALEIYKEAASFLHLALGAPDYVSVIKTVLHHRGVIASPEVRLPLLQLDEARRQEVLSAL